jgi:hypothetical protein
MEYDNSGKVSLWKNQAENPKAPVLKGTAYAHRDIKKGEPVEISLWKNDSENPKAPVLTGKVGDKQEAKKPEPKQEAPAFDDIDDLPF